MNKGILFIVGILLFSAFASAALYQNNCWKLSNGTTCINGTTGFNLLWGVNLTCKNVYTSTGVDVCSGGTPAMDYTHIQNFTAGQSPCPSGQYIFGIMQNGTINCSAPSAGTSNTSFNQSLTDTLYYSILNPNLFINWSTVINGTLWGMIINDTLPSKSYVNSSIAAIAFNGTLVPYIGASRNVNLGAYNITTTGYIYTGTFQSNGLATFSSSSDYYGLIRSRSGIDIRNKADDDWIHFATRSATGYEAVYNLNYIGTLNVSRQIYNHYNMSQTNETIDSKLAVNLSIYIKNLTDVNILNGNFSNLSSVLYCNATGVCRDLSGWGSAVDISGLQTKADTATNLSNEVTWRNNNITVANTSMKTYCDTTFPSFTTINTYFVNNNTYSSSIFQLKTDTATNFTNEVLWRNNNITAANTSMKAYSDLTFQTKTDAGTNFSNEVIWRNNNITVANISLVNYADRTFTRNNTDIKIISSNITGTIEHGFLWENLTYRCWDYPTKAHCTYWNGTYLIST